jgi:hypothetical protein
METNRSNVRAWSVPLWLAVPVTCALWVFSWILTLDPTGTFQASYVVWSATAFATAWLLMRLMRGR